MGYLSTLRLALSDGPRANVSIIASGVRRCATGFALLAIAVLSAPGAALGTGLVAGEVGPSATAEVEGPVYPTFGVHNPPKYTPDCAAPDCLVRRGPDAPSDPLLPLQWVSDWIMYRVFNRYEEVPPPYSSPPSGLTEDTDYAVTRGATYYDATYSDENGIGAMMEYYDGYCLPIFPIDSNFTCAFISLGNIAYFLTYERDRPADMPPCCRFSNLNHPPRRDFVKHLPYSAIDSARIPDVQAYSLTTPGPGGAPILFGYAFESKYRTDPDAPEAGAYRHPQSFYFSGSPTSPPDAPIVSQNYVNFSARAPDPRETWELVHRQCVGEIPWCDLFK
ncbi:MAG TPA: hypothetical protein VHG92_04510 [Afifellaceae bacterium]|nr:hypothetical protein [Afifellaceae bacterium]